jgi:hypothetical protein
MIEIQEGEEISKEVVQERKTRQGRFSLCMKNYPDVFERIFDILHLFGPAQNERDMALQNAAKMILHEGGFWGDSDEDRFLIIEKLFKVSIVRKTFWQKLFRR